MQFPNCKYCNKPAVWKRPWDNVFLCLQHFNSYFIKRVQRTINKYKLLERTDRIAVGVSGGKDSTVLLDVITQLQEKHPTEVIAISIDEGIANYREDGLKYAKLAAKRAGVEHRIYTFKDFFGYDLDDAYILLKPENMAACAYCGPFRRKALNLAARDVHATKLAVGHNADDEAQTVLMNLLRGDLLKTLHSDPTPNFKSEYFVNRIKPFRRTTEQEIVLYANFNELPYQEQSCPYAVDAYRGIMRDIITELMIKDPSVIFSIIKSADELHQIAKHVPKDIVFEGNRPLNKCKRCGEPSNQEFCQACSIELRIEKFRNNQLL